MQNPVTQVFLPLAVVLVMFALGTTLTTADLRRVLSQPRAFILGLFAHALLLPLLAFGVALAFGLEPKLAVGLVLIASCPANSTASLFTHLCRGDTMLAVCLTAGASLGSVLTVPLFVNLALRLFPAVGGPVHLPILTSALGLFLVSTLPVLAGMWLRRRRPQAARALEARLGTFGLAFIALVVATVIWTESEHVLPALARAGSAALLLNVLAVSGGWGLAFLAGLPRGQRIAVGLECGLQNFAMAVFVALTIMGDRGLLVPAVAYGLAMWLSALAVLGLARRVPAADRIGA